MENVEAVPVSPMAEQLMKELNNYVRSDCRDAVRALANFLYYEGMKAAK